MSTRGRRVVFAPQEVTVRTALASRRCARRAPSRRPAKRSASGAATMTNMRRQKERRHARSVLRGASRAGAHQRPERRARLAPPAASVPAAASLRPATRGSTARPGNRRVCLAALTISSAPGEAAGARNAALRHRLPRVAFPRCGPRVPRASLASSVTAQGTETAKRAKTCVHSDVCCRMCVLSYVWFE